MPSSFPRPRASLCAHGGGETPGYPSASYPHGQVHPPAPGWHCLPPRTRWEGAEYLGLVGSLISCLPRPIKTPAFPPSPALGSTEIVLFYSPGPLDEKEIGVLPHVDLHIVFFLCCYRENQPKFNKRDIVSGFPGTVSLPQLLLCSTLSPSGRFAHVLTSHTSTLLQILICCSFSFPLHREAVPGHPL